MKRERKSRGFTLIEMMIVVAILGIVAAIAIPSYTQHVRSSHRADAQGALIAFAQHLERRYTENNSYCDSGSAAATTDCGDTAGVDSGAPSLFSTQVPLDGGTAIYNLTIDTNITDTSFSIRATRVAGAYMDGDECGDFVYSNTGVKSQENNTSTDCNWP